MLENLPEAELRQACRLRIEALELWLRRLIHDVFSQIDPDYLSATDNNGDRLIKMGISGKAVERRSSDPARYARPADALLFDDLVSIICNPRHFPIFRDALFGAFPEGQDEARTFLSRLIAPRNQLAHANPISLRNAEQVVCYSGDVVTSLKEYYGRMGKQSAYNVPTILRVTDSLGNSYDRSQLRTVHDGGIGMFLHNEFSLRPGDILTVEIDVDPNFAPQSYRIEWASTKDLGSVDRTSPRIVIPIVDVHVGLQWTLQCKVISDRSWHRMQGGWDDFLVISYNVLPPP